MITIYKHEMKLLLKTFIIWVLAVGGMCFACILLFDSMKEDMQGMAESFSQMGAFANAFGMSQLSIATLEGFYATEIGTIHSLGAAMYAAIISMVMLSKEEDGHTSEFLFTFPVSRVKIITAKLSAVITNVIGFNIISVGTYVVGILVLGEDMDFERMLLFHGMQLLMHLEITSICFGLSAFMRKNKLGLGLGVVMVFYAYDLIVRVVPDMSDYKVLSPFSYSNAADILSTGEIEISALILGCVVTLACVMLSYVVYSKRDLAA